MQISMCMYCLMHATLLPHPLTYTNLQAEAALGLLKAGARPNVVDALGQTPLHVLLRSLNLLGT